MTTKKVGASLARPEAPPPGSLEAAVVEEVGERLRVRRSRDGAARDVVEARLARIPGYAPTVGDRVLVAFGEESYVVAVLHAASPDALVLPDGARATVEEGRLELRDARGRLLVRYEAGHAEIAAPSGDLRLAAPAGRVVLDAALDVAVEAGRDVRVAAPRRFEVTTDASGSERAASLRIEPKAATVSAPHVEVTSTSARVATGRATVLARSIATTADSIASKVTKYELTAERLVEKTRDTFRDAADLAQTRVGRMRTLVKDVLSMHARRTVVVSTDETSIDGKKVLLG
jgi:hypothetical protein